jgi:hypothetical protein
VALLRGEGRMGLQVEGAVQMTRASSVKLASSWRPRSESRTEHQQPEGVGDGNRLRPLIFFPAS